MIFLKNLNALYGSFFIYSYESIVYRMGTKTANTTDSIGSTATATDTTAPTSTTSNDTTTAAGDTIGLPSGQRISTKK